jgi:hypothetical protein
MDLKFAEACDHEGFVLHDGIIIPILDLSRGNFEK